jgi:hypothetical protein
MSKRKILPDCLSWNTRLKLKHWLVLGLNLQASRLECVRSIHLVLKPFELDQNYTLALLGLQLAD